MNSILELESEIHSSDRLAWLNEGNDGRLWAVRVHTHSVAYGHGPQIVLRIEQRCYLRAGSHVRGQDWVKPRILVDPCANTEDEALAKVTAVHQDFLDHVRARMDILPTHAGLVAAELAW